jgi:hypothetical protein
MAAQYRYCSTRHVFDELLQWRNMAAVLWSFSSINGSPPLSPFSSTPFSYPQPASSRVGCLHPLATEPPPLACPSSVVAMASPSPKLQRTHGSITAPLPASSVSPMAPLPRRGELLSAPAISMAASSPVDAIFPSHGVVSSHLIPVVHVQDARLKKAPCLNDVWAQGRVRVFQNSRFLLFLHKRISRVLELLKSRNLFFCLPYEML